jgi:hypothetical protein
MVVMAEAPHAADGNTVAWVARDEEAHPEDKPVISMRAIDTQARIFKILSEAFRRCTL